MIDSACGTFKDVLKIISLGLLASINGTAYDALAMNEDGNFFCELHSVGLPSA